LVTPILSRVAENLLVQKWIKPALPVEASEIGLLISKKEIRTAHLSNVLITSRVGSSKMIVRCLLVDCSKAFDTVDHVLVVRKLEGKGFPGSIVNWVSSFSTDCFKQLLKINGCFSDKLTINHGIVQGSGIGPYLYTVMESGLYPVSRQNDTFKFADDTNLLVSQHTDATLHIEFNN
jgi:hypothetical protein